MTPPEQAVEETPATRALVASDNPRPDITAPDTGTGDVIAPDAAELSERDAPAPETAAPPGGEDAAMAERAVQEPDAPETDGRRTGRQAGRAPRRNRGRDPPRQAQDMAAMTPDETVSPLAPEPEPSQSPVTIEEPDVTEPEQPEIPVAPEPDAAETAEPPETITAEPREDGSGQAVTRSLRPPKERPTDLALGAPDAAQQQGAQTGRASGTIESPLTTYKRTGIDPFATGSSGSSGASLGASGFAGSRNPGNARTTNYAGQVLVRLNRFPPVNRAVRGMARVSFEINPDGTVAWVNILASTGSRRSGAPPRRRSGARPPSRPRHKAPAEGWCLPISASDTMN